MSPPRPTSVVRPDFAFLDIEASSLTPGFPVEVGWSDDGMSTTSFLVRPSPRWDPLDWSYEAQSMHGLTRERVMEEGVDVQEAARRMDEAFATATLVLSDNHDHDAKWLSMIYAAAGRQPTFEVMPFEMSLPMHVVLTRENHAEWERRFARAYVGVERAFPHPHRAAPDAARLAATFRMAIDPDFMDAVYRWKTERGLDDVDGEQLRLY